MILIGSKAIKHHYPDFPREPKDTDYWVLKSDRWNKTKGTEYLECPPLVRYVDEHMDILEPDLLCTLKASHLCWDINWEKHNWDLQFLLKKGCKIDKELFFKLYNHWNEYHSKNKRSDLKMSKEDFFTNAINYNSGEHDETHKLLNPIPIYTKVLREGSEVELNEVKFEALSYEDKLDFVREEVMVMAYERYSKLGFQRAYNRMLKKFIISHAPLFSLIFILENYVVLEKCNKDFIKIINNKNDNRINDFK